MASEKDIWDKISALTPMILGVFVTAMGSVFTNVYNVNQLKLNQIIALDKLRPQLTSEKPEERAFAYSSFVALGYEDMAIKIIRVKNDQSGRAILNKLIKEGATSEIQARAKASIEKLNDAFSFGSKVLESDKPSLVLYTAEWCGPCKLVEPIFDDLAKEYDGKININIVDVDVNTETPTKYNIRGIPSIAIFKDGVDVGTKVGALSKDQIKSFIKENTNIN